LKHLTLDNSGGRDGPGNDVLLTAAANAAGRQALQRYGTVAWRAELPARQRRPSVMNRISWARACRGPLRMTALAAALLSGAALVAGCSQAGTASPSSASGAAGAGHAPAAAGPGALAPAANPVQPGNAGQPASSGQGAGSSGAGTSPPTSLAASTASIIYTATLTVRTKNVTVAARAATNVATSDGGYVSGENASASPGGHATPTISLQLKIPVAAYPGALQVLSTGLGTETSLTQQAQDVTEQMADTNSRVASAQAAIAQLRALLTRAGSVSDLLTVQDQINSEESTLEELEADQRALDDETSFATVSLTLVGPHPKAVVHRAQKPPRQHGFLAGLSAGWRGLRAVVTAVLTAVGAVLPFAAAVAVLVAAGLASRRRLARLLRRRSRPSAAG
jgi:Domain of unknown function (DUF4349)